MAGKRAVPTPSPIRPREGELICLLAEVQGTPVSHVARAGTVRETMLFVPRKPGEPVWQWDPQTPIVVLFSHEEQLYSWTLQLEEVLPASYFLASVGEPTLGARRRFVRAAVTMQLRFSTRGGPGEWQAAEVDLSSAGLRLPATLDGAADRAVGDVLELELRFEGGRGTLHTTARVARIEPQGVALEFTALASADEDAIERLVFLAREQGLAARIG